MKKCGIGSYRLSSTDKMSKDMLLRHVSRCACVCVFMHMHRRTCTLPAIMEWISLSLTHTYTHVLSQSLQAPACHENMVKVGGYILGEFGNLIAGDPQSRLESIKCLACSHQKGQCTCNTCRHQL